MEALETGRKNGIFSAAEGDMAQAILEQLQEKKTRLRHR
jgi:hypothetical protein